jgi:predicted nucleotidyltransferase
MEFPRNDLPEEIKHFFSKMKEHIEEEIYFYGSITRLDYFHGYSDIDVCIFSENIESTLSKIKIYLGSNKCYSKKLFIKYNNETINSYLMDCTNKKIDINIVDIKQKQLFLDTTVQNIPIYKQIMLCLLKYCFFYLKLFDKEKMKYFKKNIFDDINKKSHITHIKYKFSMN